MPKGLICEESELCRLLARARQRGQRVVFTNGCFDLLHPGHVSYLEEARALGDLLIVGLNADVSVRRLKGERRPILPENARARLLAALAAVDYVVIFSEATPYHLIELIQPDVLVKGGDWAPETIVGHEVVEARGGEVLSLPFIGGYSTSMIIDEILERYREES
jgi:D-beta-D-heptose 7-phosphate kinase/D-beta-D-heptose 1-phosphate adenosyltransferase